MPFKSKEQRSFLKRTKPDIYKKWKKKYGLEIKREGGKKQMIKKVKRKPTEWNKHMMKVYKEMKKKKPATKLGEAMKVAKISYKPKKK